MIEFALVIFIFFVFVIGLFDFVRYLVVQSILRSAASRALSHAQVVDWLDANCSTLPTPADITSCVANRNAAFVSVLGILEAIPTNTLVSREAGQGMHWMVAGTATAPAAELILSQPSANDYRAYYRDGRVTTPLETSPNLTKLNGVGGSSRPTLRNVLQDEPIQVRIRATFHPVFALLGEIPLEGMAAGYREVRGASSYPSRVNCLGAEVPIGTPFGNASLNVQCPCPVNPANPSIISVNGTCSCASNQLTPVKDQSGALVNCICPNSKMFDGKNCVCLNTSCANGTVLDPQNCDCVCPGNQTKNGERCGCSPPYVQNGINCGCPAKPTCKQSGGLLDPITCMCTCPKNKPIDEAGDCGCKKSACEAPGVTNSTTCKCECPANFELHDGECICRSPHVQQGNQCLCVGVQCINGNVNQTSCGCTCEASKVLQNGQCVCPSFPCNPPGIPNTGSCTCQCPANFTVHNGNCVCTSPHMQNGNSCSCTPRTCTGGWQDQNDCACHCSNPKIFDGSACQCPTGGCGGGTIDPNSCGCNCPSGQVPVHGTCSCPGQQVYNGTACYCANGGTGLNCACSQNQVVQNGVCKCPEDTAMMLDGSCFKPE